MATFVFKVRVDGQLITETVNISNHSREAAEKVLKARFAGSNVVIVSGNKTA